MGGKNNAAIAIPTITNTIIKTLVIYSHFKNLTFADDSHNSGGLAKFFMFVILAMVVWGIVRQCMLNSRANSGG
jgi:hypothetical protein